MHDLFYPGIRAPKIGHAYFQFIKFKVARYDEVRADAGEVPDYKEAFIAIASAI